MAQPYSRQDSLRGSISAERAWWDLGYYYLDIEVLPDEKIIKGSNLIQYRVLKPGQVMQIDLQAPMKISQVVQGDEVLSFVSNGNAHFIHFDEIQEVGQVGEIRVYYQGKPREARRPPWDGGITWSRDQSGEHFIASTCQGLGASVWWPCKDHMYDEVDSMDIRVEVPAHLTNVSNGRLIDVVKNDRKGTRTFHYQVRNPINNYGVNINIGNYTSWNETYSGEKGELDLVYWALNEDEVKARKQFTQVPKMLKAFEHWFGPYPFYEDGYKLVQAPYLGMEHQSSITYGNEFVNGYRGSDLSGTGWGMKFDFIIIHESGHEWFANNITHKDQADMWLHESFTNYSESLYLEYYHGKDAGQEYVRGTRFHIENKKPMIGTYDVNDSDYPLDVYYKGGNMLNTLRTILDDDEKWLGVLRGLNKEFYHRTIASSELEEYMADYLNLDLSSFFDQYLRDPRLPVLEYFFQNDMLHYRWMNTISSFDMVVDVTLGDKEVRLKPSTNWTTDLIKKVEELKVNPNYYVATFQSR
jgi:aminopeptidase N